MEPSSSATTGDTVPRDDLGLLMSQLGLKEGDLDDLVFEEEAPKAKEPIRWMAVVRVYTEKNYSQAAFFKTMRAAWDLSKESTFRTLEPNLYSIKFKCLAEWEKAMEGDRGTSEAILFFLLNSMALLNLTPSISISLIFGSRSITYLMVTTL